MKQKPRPRPPEPEDEDDLDAQPREDVVVRGSPARCPFCHDDCPAEGSVACRDCLARHHRDCWDEGGACAACGATQRFVTEARLKDLLDEHPLAEVLERARGRAPASDDASLLRLMSYLAAANYGLGAGLGFVGNDITFLLGLIATICFSGAAGMAAYRSRDRLHRRRLAALGIDFALGFVTLVFLPALFEGDTSGWSWSAAGAAVLTLASVAVGVLAPRLLPPPDEEA